MNPETENFEQLRRLLALKRHEQPPPRYFNNFSSQVIQRLHGGEKGGHSAFDTLFGEAPWLQRLWQVLEGRPALAGGFGAAVCALAILGVVAVEQMETPSSAPGLFAEESTPASPFGHPSSLALNGADERTLVSSTNPFAPPGGSLFDQIPPGTWHPGIHPQPVAVPASAPGGN